ncbi:hypothetical protein RB195_014025 [Necator americanus]|uniref:Uncharacterized protein n=1 Tax=Necator americanus TaxID=51031 RepID=A0ABR1DYD8_NECAM
MSNYNEIKEQNNLILSALPSPPERKISRISLRKTSGIGEDYVDVIVDPFPALPINIRVPSLRKKSADDETQSTTNIHKKYTEGDRLKQWEKLEVLPDTAATAALAQLVLARKESIKPDTSGTKKTFIPMKRNLKRTTSLDWSGKLFVVPAKPKLRFTSQMNCQELSVNVSNIDTAKEDLRTVSATLEKQTAGKVLQKLPKELSVPKENRCHELELTSRTTEMGSRSVPNSPTTVKPHLLLPEVPHESPICTRKLTPMPRDLHPPHLTKPWHAVLEANHRFQHSIHQHQPKAPPISPPVAHSGRRHSFDRPIGFAKRTINRTAHYFVQILRDWSCLALFIVDFADVKWTTKCSFVKECLIMYLTP